MRKGGSSRRSWVALSLLYLAAGNAHADDDFWTFGSPGGEPASRHGQISIGYQVAHTEGLVNQDGAHFFDSFATDVQSLNLDVDYWLGERWSVHASLPFIRKRSVNDPGSHNLNILTVPHPESRYIDDGEYHGAWQDWSLGVEYHASLGTFEVTPHLYIGYPSHDYTFFAAAAVGQNLKKARLGADVSQRVGRSNFHYSVGYSYEFVEEVFDINTDKQHFRLSAWYDFSPQLSARVFANGRKGKGLTNADVNRIDPGPNRTSELWYQHDRLLTYDYAIAGIGSTWRFNERWAVSASAASMVWVRVNYDLKYAYELQLLRSF